MNLRYSLEDPWLSGHVADIRQRDMALPSQTIRRSACANPHARWAAFTDARVDRRAHRDDIERQVS
ncbi:hypothetical protein [Paraburkholderia aspalathi]|uniref:hypothetical protein n=1 Tax=Paraburkholderia aspalathi TaxID=1324617 RepID=UPI000B887DF4|nr:hypothetical protein [Paraburkholderia aspalathi]